jgi:CelD/BcsL family acetyltransferase involved in cellulose biosynthesis
MLSRPLQTKSVNSVAELGPRLDDWRTLAAGRPMRSPEWLLGWWATYAMPGDELRIFLVTDTEETLVGLAPLYLQKYGGGATFQALGARDHCTHHTDWLATPGFEADVGRAIARSLLQCHQDWQKLLFDAVAVDAEAIRATMDHLTGQGFLGHQRQVNNCWKISLPATWDDYLQMLSRSLRKRCRRLQRQFFDSGKITLRQVEKEADLEEGIQVLLKLHAARWGSTKQSLGVFSDQKFRNFHESVSRQLLINRQLRLAWLECDGHPIAVEYQFFNAEVVYAYQAGLDLKMSEYAPGKLSMMAAIQFAIAKGCQTFDLLGGDEPYKSNWRAEPIVCHDLRVWQRSPRGLLEWSGWSLYTMAASRLKPLIPEPLVNFIFKLLRSIKEVCEPMWKSLR